MSTTPDHAERDRIWTVDEHLDDILRNLTPLDPADLPILDAHGCVLAEDVTVPVALPPFDNSSMDGYAVRTADVAGATGDAPRVLTVIGDVHAGLGELPTVRPGEAARIMTGAPLPPGADAVVPVEWTDAGSGAGPAIAMRAHSADPSGATGEVRVHRPVEPGGHVRARGSDVTEGELALAAGTLLGPPQIGLLAAVGRARVRVRPRPRVVVISTGSELVPPGEQLTPGRIHDSNSYALVAAARDAGADARRVDAVADEVASLRAVVAQQLSGADIVVTSGGVSVGAYDVVKEALGGEDGMQFRKLAMQPGKPQGFGLIGPGRTPLFGLPGNPVSSYVSFELFVRPAIRALMGIEPARRETVRARCTGEITHSPKGRRQFLRGRYDPEGGTVAPVGGSGSHLVKALAHADALIVVPEDVTDVTPGTDVEVILLT
ncbi:molybdopterin molybdotransferase MoeA [Streptomyces sp. RB6PN25]|uniref:Molybdopterin molybdenumtransferase n=1 Tax=Streptomyces humicola TaxID=2953240 RepID=A0ABT1PSC7_9ACTN|nr:gephyrin-like molybdotransferase Glp [Streptomyces humicola]MCQ4080579.1 molybdopterin molybdotransferase MoeA [Streptomyces humicola]